MSSSPKNLPKPIFVVPKDIVSTHSVPGALPDVKEQDDTLYQETDLAPVLPLPEVAPSTSQIKRGQSTRIKTSRSKSSNRKITTNDSLIDYSTQDNTLPLPSVNTEPSKKPSNTYSRPKKTKEEKRDNVNIVSLYEDWISLIPVPSERDALNPKAHSKSWFISFQKYINHLLRAVYKDENVRKFATMPELMDIWRRAFTDPSFGADHYETLETIGDKVLDYAFVKYVYTRRPNVSPMILSNFRNNYMSKANQPKFATDLKMEQWILFGEAMAADRERAATADIREDVFEAFCAALDTVGNAVHSLFISQKKYKEALEDAPIGAQCVQRFITTIMDGRGGLDERYEITAAKTILLEYGTIFGLGKKYSIEFIKPKAGTVGGKYTVILPEKLGEALEAAGIKKLPKVLASSTDETEAANMAYEKMAKAGADFKWKINMQEVSNVSKYVGTELYNEMRQVAGPLGYPKLFYSKPEHAKRKDGTFSVILNGSDVDDNVVVLGSDIGKDLRQVKINIAKEFIAKYSKNTL